MEPMLVTIINPMPFDVVLRRGAAIGRWAAPHPENSETNVPWSVISHSPDGFEWGYGGSGPADLALNILNAFVPPGQDGHMPVECHRGRCSWTAMRLHQDFKRTFIVGMPHAGGTIRVDDILGWLMAHPTKAPAGAATPEEY